ncbi:unnamed protein product [Rotaria sp. Silwood1]|nr:unnamed protein product [Rotaria sp. Silwood1]CAF1542675.1 unnamed protein product [Rotaria sp. Silwood1]CAF1548222.1 unnamed protein product [Rotaria sp. Silwood1]CAF3660358.1 unnamed protein product [Rotaria sp. Silwood1]CAF3667330.1 unnamed protein product [Rotaria sp. Silwood1]
MADVTYEVFESADHLDERFSLDGRTSIGYPIENMRVEIVEPDERGVGELVVKGEGVANGYHNVDPSNILLSNKFIRDNDGKFRFRTGDLGRIWNGRIILYGRNDTQIKIAGNRVDLSEIELKLKQYCQCRQPVAVHSSTYGHIIVFLEAEENPFSLNHEFLSKYLPSYAIPTRFVKIPHLPLLVSGKIDRQQLIKLVDAQYTSMPLKQEVKEESNIKQAFYSALADIGIPRTHVDRNFLAAGGSSLTALTLIAKLHRIGFQDLNVERLMYATSLKDILNNRAVIGQQKHYDPFSQCEGRYKFVPLESVDKFEAQRILIESFVELNEIDALVHHHQADLKQQCKLEWLALLDAFWSYFVTAGLSFGIYVNDGQLVGISLSKDLADQPHFDMPDMPLLSPLFAVFETERNKLIEDLRYRQLLPESIMHGFLTAVNPNVKPEQRVTIMYLLERHVLRIAATKQFQAVVTANASRVTQQLAEQVFKYEFNQVVHVNQYRDSTGTLVFPHAQDHHTAIISMKLLHDH